VKKIAKIFIKQDKSKEDSANDKTELDSCKNNTLKKEKSSSEENGGGSQSIDSKYFTETELVPENPASVRESIKQKFLVDMPEDFYDFFKFCQDLNKDNPCAALASVGLRLVGAFDVVAGLPAKPPTVERWLCHWRFYRDPPELQTVLAHTTSELHLGYFRDDPNSPPAFLAQMGGDKSKPYAITPMAANIFDAVRVYCIEQGKKADPFQKAEFAKMTAQLESAGKQHKFALDTRAEAVRVRRPRVVCRTLHGAGLVVPYDKKTEVGYRELPETDASLRRILQRVADAKTDTARRDMFADVEELMTNAQWATDEGDCGMSLELGLALWLHGCPHLEKAACHLMGVPYALLGRDPFARVLKAHMKNRREGNQLSAFE